MHYRTFHFHISPELGAKLPIPGGYENIGGSIIVRVPDNSRDRLYLAVSKGEGRTSKSFRLNTRFCTHVIYSCRVLWFVGY